MTVARSSALFVVAALAEIGGAWLVWQGVRERRGGGRDHVRTPLRLSAAPPTTAGQGVATTAREEEGR